MKLPRGSVKANKLIPVADTEIGRPEELAVRDVVRSRWLSSGPRVKAFEEKFSRVVGGGEAVAVNNGTSALHVALMALGIGRGDEVIVPSLTFISSANVVLYQGAKPVLADCDPATYNITPEAIEKRITSRTKAVMPVDMNGMPYDYEGVAAVCRKKGIPIVADSAESLGAVYKGRKIGSIENIHCFSFFPNKNITTGEGGMVVTKSKAHAAKMRIYLNQGQEGRYNHTELGYNYRMNELQAAIGLCQLDRLPDVIRAKEAIARRYQKGFEGVAGVSTPHVPRYVSQHAWYMYSISVRAEIRDRMVRDLADLNIQTRLSFPPVHIQAYYRRMFGCRPTDCPKSLEAWSRKIDIPIFRRLTVSEQSFVISSVKRLAAKYAI